MTLDKKIKYTLLVLLSCVSLYFAWNIRLRFQSDILWGHYLLFFWCCTLIAISLFIYLINKDSLKKKYLNLSVLSAVLLGLGFMNTFSFYLIFIALIPILKLEELISSHSSKPKREFFKYVLFSLFIWNILSTWWIQNSSLIAGILGNFLNALFMCIPLLLYQFTKQKLGSRAAYFGWFSYWLSYEIGHLNWDLSWPWLCLGNSFAPLPQLVQWYEFTGVMGGTFWILAINLFLFHYFFSSEKEDNLESKPYFKAGLLIFLPVLCSLVRFYTYQPESKKTIKVMAVQPNYEPHYDKFTIPQSEQLKTFDTLIRSQLDTNLQYVIMPETSFRSIELENISASRPFQKFNNYFRNFPELNLIFGLSAYKLYKKGDKIPNNVYTYCNEDRSVCNYVDAFNVAVQMQPNIKPEWYKKSKLVPGAESMPFIGDISLFKSLILDLGGAPGLSLGTQKERSVFKGPAKIAPLICYESVYGGYVTDFVRKGANLLTVITNDGWWDNTAGHIQHMQLSSLRAIENRKHLVRSANSGISCFINSKGVIYKRTNYNERTVLKGSVILDETATFYTAYGDILGRISLLMSIWLLISIAANNIQKRKQNTV